MLVGISALATYVCQAETTSVTNDGVFITWENPEPKHKYEEPQEIRRCRSIWPDAHFRCEGGGGTNSWQCIVIPHPKAIVLSDVLECRKAILDCGWKPVDAAISLPTAVPPKYQSSSEQFRKDDQILWLSFSADGIKLKSRKTQQK